MEEMCNVFVEEYLAWLREQIRVSELNGVCEVTVPFLDRHNDYLQIYITPDGEQYILTDDGYALSDLRMSGIDSNAILRGFGVEIDDGRLQVKTTRKNLAEKSHVLLQSMLSICSHNPIRKSKTDGHRILRQLMADAIDAYELVSQAADNPAFEPEDRETLDATAQALSRSILAASTWLKAQTPRPPEADAGERVLVDFNGDLTPCVLLYYTDAGQAVVKDALIGETYTVDADQIRREE